MTPDILKTNFTTWLVAINQPNLFTDRFLLACLEEAIDSTLNTTIYDTPAYEYFSEKDLMNYILDNWLSTAKLFLQHPDGNINFTFRNVTVPKGDQKRNVLLSELSSYIQLCKSS